MDGLMTKFLVGFGADIFEKETGNRTRSVLLDEK